jgi:hypothetical protein
MSDSKPTITGGALRLQAYRRRLNESDLVRAEILLPRSVRDAIQAIAKTEGAKYLETVSALAQMGLETYQGYASTVSPSEGLAGTHALRSCSALAPQSYAASANFASAVTGSALSSAALASSPLARFLKSRKDVTDES